jgi:quercetin dioxygenase-like cupin family protein
MAISATEASARVIRDPVSRVRYVVDDHEDGHVVDTWIEPGGGLPPHLHPVQEEVWTVVEGKVRFRLGRGERVIAPEDGEIHVAPGAIHAVTAVTASEARLRVVVTPKLRFRPFLEESAAAAQQGLFTEWGMPRGLAGARFAAVFLKRYQRETVFVRPPRPLQWLLMALLARGV